jgi:hypothetical protein
VLGDSIDFHDIPDIVTKGIPPIYGKSLGMVHMVDMVDPRLLYLVYPKSVLANKHLQIPTVVTILGSCKQRLLTGAKRREFSGMIHNYQ